MSKIGPRPLLDTEIRLDDVCHVLLSLGMKWPYMYIYIQLDRIPMTAVYSGRAAVSTSYVYRCMNGMQLYRIGALAAPDSSDPEEYGRLA